MTELPTPKETIDMKKKRLRRPKELMPAEIYHLLAKLERICPHLLSYWHCNYGFCTRVRGDLTPISVTDFDLNELGGVYVNKKQALTSPEPTTHPITVEGIDLI